jgi:hypothetical protein
MRRVEPGSPSATFHAELAWPAQSSPFMNVNTPEELKRAEARLARARDHAPVDEHLCRHVRS